VCVPLAATQLALVLPSHRGGASAEVSSSADEVHVLSLNFATAREQLAALRLDVLVFGEMNSEPLNHFLGGCVGGWMDA
jgi:hypothetical protein